MNDDDLRRLVGAWTALAALLVVINPGGWMQTAVVAAFVLVCPGLAWSRRLGLADTVDALAVGVGVSLAVGALVAQVLALTGWWHPGAALSVLVAVTVAGLALPGRPRRGPDRGAPDRDAQLDQTRT